MLLKRCVIIQCLWGLWLSVSTSWLSQRWRFSCWWAQQRTLRTCREKYFFQEIYWLKPQQDAPFNSFSHLLFLTFLEQIDIRLLKPFSWVKQSQWPSKPETILWQIYLLFSLGPTTSSAQSFLLAPYLGITPSGRRGPYGMAGTETWLQGKCPILY